MQQKLDGQTLFIKASKEESSVIRAWHLMTLDKNRGYWYAEISIGLLEKLQQTFGLIPPAQDALTKLRRIQAAVDKERIRPDKDVECYIDPPVKVKLYKHQERAYNMALINFGLLDPDITTQKERENHV